MTQQPMYSWMGSPLHIPLSERVAEAYNRFHQAFFDGQAAYLAEHGTPWTPDKPIAMEIDEEAEWAWNKVGEIINTLVELCDGGIAFTEEETPADFLIRIN